MNMIEDEEQQEARRERTMSVINQKLRFISTVIGYEVLTNNDKGRLYMRGEDGDYIDLVEEKELLEGMPQVTGKVYREIDKTHKLLKSYVEEFGSLVPRIEI